MTNEEAIEVIKDIYNYTKWDTYTTNEARTMAIKALEKAEPEFVNYASDGDADGYPVYDFAYCPNCDRLFEEDDENWETNYCPYCGKALKWWEDIDDDE